MKSFLIIGLGRFGTHLCKDLSKLDNEIMVVDENEAVMEDVLSFVTSAKIGDCTNEKVLATLGVGNFDVCFVCIGSNFQSSLEITSLLKEMGARYVVSKANRDIPNFCCGTVLTKLSTLTGISQKKLQSVSLPTRSLTTLN